MTGESFEAGAGHDMASRMALRGLAILAQLDAEKSAAGQRHWTPNLRVPALSGRKKCGPA